MFRRVHPPRSTIMHKYGRVVKIKMLTTTEKRILADAWHRGGLAAAGYRCEICGSRAGELDDCGGIIILDCHHILPKGRWPEYRYERMNRICTCRKCHSKPYLILRRMQDSNDRRYRWYVAAHRTVRHKRDLQFKRVYRKLAA